ncbi:MAG: hypothetical protein ACLFUR_00080 [Candidatus Hadarchaeia archaeon]
MEFGSGFWEPIVATGGILLGALISWIVIRINHSLIPQSPTKRKTMTYGCGEEVKAKETIQSADQFYSPIRRTFGKLYEELISAHSGDLSSYLLWIISGFIVILLWIMIKLV